VVGGTVLLVEHEGPVRSYLEQQLSEDGFEVLSADRSVEALDLAGEVKPDLDATVPRWTAHFDHELGCGRTLACGAHGSRWTLGLQDHAGLHRSGRRDVPR
jgi:hypothetical protein